MCSSSPLPSDILHSIASYLDDAATLASLDLVCREMRQLTEKSWSQLSLSRGFQMGGKKAWRTGLSLLLRQEDPIVVSSQEWRFCGSTMLAENGRIMVVASDCCEHDDDDNKDLPENPLQIRDCETMEVLHHVDHGDNAVWQVAICGPQGNEIIVTTTIRQVLAFRQDQTMILHHHDDPSNSTITVLQETKLLGKDDILMVFRSGSIYVYRPTAPDNTESMLELISKVAYVNHPDLFCSTTAWSSSPGKSQFGLSYKEGRVCIWDLGGADDKTLVRPVETLTYDHPGRPESRELYENLTFNDVFVVAVRDNSLMTVFDRTTGVALYEILETLPALGSRGRLSEQGELTRDEDDDDENSASSDSRPNICIYGSYLISSSNRGCVLGVWHLPSAKSSFRSIEPSTIPGYSPAAGASETLVQLSGWNYLTFCTPIPGGSLLLWGFPKSSEDQAHFESIRVREEARSLKSARSD